MASNTKIEWATHTFNQWIGCTKVASGCANCYAEAMAGRLGVVWGPSGTRRRTADSTWRQVERWNRQAECNCDHFEAATKPPMEVHHWDCPQADRPRVFPSLCDPFEMWSGVVQDSKWLTMHTPDGQQYLTMDDVRRDFFALIDRTPNLDWLLLTKRPENIRRMWCSHVNTDGKPPSQLRRENIWLIYSASDQQSLEAGLPHLLACRDLVPVLGLSLEPLVGPVDVSAALVTAQNSVAPPGRAGSELVNWIICGGESGPHARPMDLAWLESIADQCAAANVPLFVKQDSGRKPGQQGRIPDALWARKELPTCPA